MERKKMPRSIRKHIRQQKAHIRRAVFDKEEQKKLIEELYQQFLPKQAEVQKPKEDKAQEVKPTKPRVRGLVGAKR